MQHYNPIQYRRNFLKIGKIKDSHILDVGTGSGYLAILAAKGFNCKVTSIDIYSEKIEKAKEKADKEKVLNKIQFKLQDIKKPFLDKNSFDAVLSFSALHHINNYPKAINEMFRIAKEKIIISELNAKGVEIFDKYVHPDENHKKMAIELNKLNKVLKKHTSKIKRHKTKLMDIFVCEKEK